MQFALADLRLAGRVLWRTPAFSLVAITRQGGGNASPPMFNYWRENDTGIDDLTAFDDGAAAMNLGGDRPELVQMLRVSHNFFHLFGAYPIVGRTFTVEEDRSGAPDLLLASIRTARTRRIRSSWRAGCGMASAWRKRTRG